METLLSIIAGLASLKLTFKFFFDDRDDLAESIKYWFTPDIISIFRGEFDRDWWAEFKLFIWLALGVLTGYAVHRFLMA